VAACRERQGGGRCGVEIENARPGASAYSLQHDLHDHFSRFNVRLEERGRRYENDVPATRSRTFCPPAHRLAADYTAPADRMLR
jgi:hypothetical protein